MFGFGQKVAINDAEYKAACELANQVNDRMIASAHPALGNIAEFATANSLDAERIGRLLFGPGVTGLVMGYFGVSYGTARKSHPALAKLDKDWTDYCSTLGAKRAFSICALGNAYAAIFDKVARDAARAQR
jgi:hypothetical protein